MNDKLNTTCYVLPHLQPKHLMNTVFHGLS